MQLDGDISFMRQTHWFDPSKIKTELTVIGCGGIGSWFSFLAAKMGIDKITLYDDDIVESHNLPNQFFRMGSIGENKVDALANSVREFTAAEVKTEPNRFANKAISGLVVSGVDSMKSREEIWRKLKGRKNVQRYWDARIGGENITIYSVDPNDEDECALYETTLYSDDDALELPCTQRAVIDIMGYTGSLLVTSIRKYLAGEKPHGLLIFNAETFYMDKCSLVDTNIEVDEKIMVTT